MTWLAWRRHRTNLIIVAGVTVALVAWMLLIRHWFDESIVVVHADGRSFRTEYFAGPHFLQAPYQVAAVNALLLVLPSVAGVLLGVPLVAGELEDRTNRLAWSQGTSRTRWFLAKFGVLGLPVVVLAAVLSAVGRWWAPHVIGTGPGSIQQIAGYSWFNRIHPAVFTVLGIVPVAYALFAFALGAALGAFLRRTPWAVLATITAYAAVLVLMTLVVRPNLTPQLFVPDQAIGTSPLYAQLDQNNADPWMTGQGFRFVPGSHPPSGASAGELGARCDNQSADVSSCYSSHDIEYGSSYVLASQFWALQWRESALVFGATVALLLAGLWSVRRWRA